MGPARIACMIGLRPTAMPYGYDTVHLEGPDVVSETDAVAASTCTVSPSGPTTVAVCGPRRSG